MPYLSIANIKIRKIIFDQNRYHGPLRIANFFLFDQFVLPKSKWGFDNTEIGLKKDYTYNIQDDLSDEFFVEFLDGS